MMANTLMMLVIGEVDEVKPDRSRRGTIGLPSLDHLNASSSFCCSGWAPPPNVASRSPQADIVCPTCGQPLQGWRPAFESALVTLVDDRVSWVQRTFSGVCPVHGLRLSNARAGHHLTMGPTARPSLQARYGRDRSKILGRLAPEIRSRFKLALKGTLAATEADLALWDDIALGG